MKSTWAMLRFLILMWGMIWFWMDSSFWAWASVTGMPDCSWRERVSSWRENSAINLPASGSLATDFWASRYLATAGWSATRSPSLAASSRIFWVSVGMGSFR